MSNRGNDKNWRTKPEEIRKKCIALQIIGLKKNRNGLLDDSTVVATMNRIIRQNKSIVIRLAVEWIPESKIAMSRPRQWDRKRGRSSHSPCRIGNTKRSRDVAMDGWKKEKPCTSDKYVYTPRGQRRIGFILHFLLVWRFNKSRVV